MKILLIDDEKFTRRELCGFFEDEGYTVIMASDGEEGLEVFEKEEPEIVITDVNMPRLGGFEVLKSIKSKNPETRVLILTGHGDEDMAIRALKEGANDYIKKPINLNSLIESIEKASDSIKNFRKTAFNASTVVSFNQHIEVENDPEGIYALTSYITTFNQVYFSRSTCEKIKLSLIESLRNAIEHGNLGISYEEKGQMLEKGEFNNEIKKRLKISPYKERKVKILYSLNQERVKYTIEDQGQGFDWKKLPGTTPESLLKRNGRGIVLTKMMMDEISHNEKGNCVTLIKKSDKAREMENESIWVCQSIKDKDDLR